MTTGNPTPPQQHAIPISVSEGFLPHFSADFRARYGEDSLFVRAVSDFYTQAVVRTLWRRNKLRDPSRVALFASPDAVRAIKELMERLTDRGAASNALLMEATGGRPSGTFEQIVDTEFATGFFAGWLEAFQAGCFDQATATIPVPTVEEAADGQ